MNTSLLVALPVFLAGAFSLAQTGSAPVFQGPYLGQRPPGMVPERFAPGFISTPGCDLTLTFSPTLDEVFFGRRPTEQDGENQVFYSRMLKGRWQTPTLASFSLGGMEYDAPFSVDGNPDIYWVDAKVIGELKPSASGQK